MVFASYEFLFLFLPIVVFVYFMIGKRYSIKTQHIFLVLASLFFYGYFNISYLWIMLASIGVNYLLALLIQEKTRYQKLYFISGILFNVGLLGYFKYYDFFIENINFIFNQNFVLKNILLPLGISFFTFQQFSFLLSVYKGEEKVDNIVNYSLFVTFFPQLVAGPIVLYSEMIPQFNDETKKYINYDHLAHGIYIFILGLFKKIVIADTLALFVDNGFDGGSSLGFASAWVISLSYSLQIYFDFSGYSDMAIGIGKMLNINLPSNFNSPYQSASVGEFWRRWHITLGRALSAYIYIPLGGSRKGQRRTYLNLMIVFFVSGLWHGASWTFIVWGLLHGLVSVFERIFKEPLSKVPHALRVAGTFLFVNATWVLFRAESWESAIRVLKGMFIPQGFNLFNISTLTTDGIIGFPTIISVVYLLGIISILLWIVFTRKNTLQMAEEFTYDNRNLIFLSILFSFSVVHLSRISTFIYFNF